jgi:hypothetical protein
MARTRIGDFKALALVLVGAALITAASALAAYGEPLTSVQYRLYHWENSQWMEYCPGDQLPAGGDQPGTNLWKYDYTVYNYAAPQPLREAYTFFNSENIAMYATLVSAAAPTGWTATQIGPFAPDFNWKERFRTTSSTYYIQLGQYLAGFSVQFTWTKAELPGAQNSDVVFSGGSEAYVTMSPCPPAAVEETTWGGVKATYR